VAGDGCRGRKHDGSRKARPEAAALRFADERASGDSKGNGPLSAGEVEWEADDADRRTAVGRREQGVMSLGQRRAVSRAVVAIG
jgi:hypothetical protein